ncbi:MAG: sortase [Candidatus Azambacteria bacterium]|nr:sortase [Candidatus Azambacteria bacterium]
MTFNLKREITIFLAIFFAASFFIYLLLNGGAYFRILRYDLFLRSPFAEAGLKNQPILNLNKSYYLYIPKIDVSAPIVLPKDESNKSVLAGLEEGVALYFGSQLPGEIGRSVILGHSSKTSWYRGEYAYIFALLSKLQSGDEFYIVSGNKKLTYKVFSNDILTPEQTNKLLSQIPQNESDVALITCWPIGFSSMRTLIQAKLDHIEKI